MYKPLNGVMCETLVHVFFIFAKFGNIYQQPLHLSAPLYRILNGSEKKRFVKVHTPHSGQIRTYQAY